MRRKKTPNYKKANFLGGRFWFVILILLVVFGVGVLAVIGWTKFTSMDVFTLEYIQLEGGSTVCSSEDIMKRINKKNLWEIDLPQLSYKISRWWWPYFEQVYIQRQFPDTLKIILVERKPFAQLKLNRFYLISDSQIVLPPVLTEPHPGYPVIEGSRVLRSKVGIGELLRDERISLALKVLDEFRSLGSLFPEYNITSINVRQPSNIQFYLKGYPVQIRVSQDQLSSAFEILPELLKRYKEKLAGIEYIDLRFRRPIIAPRG